MIFTVSGDSFQGGWYVLYLLLLGCRGGGLCVICAKSVTVTLLRTVCFVCLSLSFGFDKKVFISLFQD